MAIDPERPVFLCGKCEDFCTDVEAHEDHLRGVTVFTVGHHGRKYRQEIDQGELLRITASNVPAVDVAGWPQDSPRGNGTAEANQMRSGSYPLLYCGKCDQRMNQQAVELLRESPQNVEVTSCDFAVSCHGDMYVLNLEAQTLTRMMGSDTAAPQRLDVCDPRGMQYPHQPPRHENTQALVGTKVSPSGVVFDPQADPKALAVVGLTSRVSYPQVRLDWQLSGSAENRQRFKFYRVSVHRSGQELFSAIVQSSEAYFLEPGLLPGMSDSVNGQGWSEFQFRVNACDAGCGIITEAEITVPAKIIPRYTPPPPKPKAPADAVDPVTGLTPAAQDGMQQVAMAMIRARRDGGPVTDALKNMAAKLKLDVLDRLHMAPDGRDLRVPMYQPNGNISPTVGYNEHRYTWSVTGRRYVRTNLAGVCLEADSADPEPVLATLPAPEDDQPKVTRRIILED